MPHLLVLILITLSLFFSACSNTVATAKYRSSFNFSSLKSYSTYDRNSPFSDFQNISDTKRNSIEIAIEQVLDNKGYHYKRVDNADIVITYHLVNRNRKELKKYNRGIRYCHWCLNVGVENINDRHWQMKPGSLIIDLVDIQDNRSVWRSVYPLSLDEKDSSFEIQEKIVLAISAMMLQLPKAVI